MKLTKQQIERACNWWAKVILSPKMDSGSRDDAAVFGDMLGRFLASRHEPDALQVEQFKKELAIELRKHSNEYFVSCFGTDYHPDSILAEAAKRAGIDEVVFPIKTMMRFDRGGCQVKYGYSARDFEEVD